MTTKIDDLTKTPLWNRKILNAYWYSLLMYAGTTFANILWLYIGNEPINVYRSLMEHLLGGSVAITFILVLAEISSRKKVAYSDYVIIVTGTVFALIIIYLNSHIRHIHSVILLPMLLSMFYFQRRKLYFACALNTTAFILLVAFVERVNKYIWFPNTIPMIAITIAGCLILIGVMSRGEETMLHFEKNIAAQQAIMADTEQMERLSNYDALTGLHNHQAFHNQFEQAITIAHSESSALHLVLIDLDRFKSVNDTFGHHAGDAVLARTANRMALLCDPGFFVSRYGGEEFAILIPGLDTVEVLDRLERLRLELQQIRHPELDGNTVTASMGVVQLRGGATKAGLFQSADEALYRAKHTGRNTICLEVAHGDEREDQRSEEVE